MTSPSSAVERFDRRVGASVAKAQGKPVRKDGPSGRFYAIEGEDFPSVTHILSCIGKPALINWAASQERTLVMDTAADLYLDLAQTPPMSRPVYLTTLQKRLGKEKAHKRQLAKAGEIGTQVHKLVEWNNRRTLGQEAGPEPHVVDDAQWAFMAYQDWASSVNLEPVLIEQTVFSRQYRYAGTMDLLAKVNGRLHLIDFKTSKAVYNEAHLQNVAYQVALTEMGHGDPVGGLIVRLPKLQSDPEFEVVECPSVDQLFDTFLSVVQVWKWWHANEVAYQEKRRAKAGVA